MEATPNPAVAAAKSLSHPTRAAILLYLAEHGPSSPTQVWRAEIASGVKLGVISYHFRELAKHNTIQLDSTKPRRGALEHYYRLSSNTWVALAALKALMERIEVKPEDDSSKKKIKHPPIKERTL